MAEKFKQANLPLPVLFRLDLIFIIVKCFFEII
jgi:hypothetical protein